MNADRIKLLELYIEEEPENPFNKYALAMEYYESKPDNSIELLLSLIQDHPSYLPSYYKAAHLLWELEDYDQAKTLFEKGIELAKLQNDEKTLGELNAAFLNFQFEQE